MKMLRILRCREMTSTEEKDIWDECGASLKDEKEKEIYEALRRALLNHTKLLATFPK